MQKEGERKQKQETSSLQRKFDAKAQSHDSPLAHKLHIIYKSKVYSVVNKIPMLRMIDYFNNQSLHLGPKCL